jgi:hypothetical protein
MNCLHCGCEFTARIGSKFCKDECRRAAEKIQRRKPRPETQCRVCLNSFTPSRHGQLNCDSCHHKGDLALKFRRWIRKTHLKRRALRAQTTRGVPRIQDAALPILKDDWRASELFQDFARRHKYETHGLDEPDRFNPVLYPDPNDGWNAVEVASTARYSLHYELNYRKRDARIAWLVWVVGRLPYPKTDKSIHSERGIKNGDTETRAKLPKCRHGMPAKWCSLCVDTLLGDVISHPSTETQPENGDYHDEEALYEVECDPEVPGLPSQKVEGENY